MFSYCHVSFFWGVKHIMVPEEIPTMKPCSSHYQSMDHCSKRMYEEKGPENYTHGPHGYIMCIYIYIWYIYIYIYMQFIRFDSCTMLADSCTTRGDDQILQLRWPDRRRQHLSMSVGFYRLPGGGAAGMASLMWNQPGCFISFVVESSVQIGFGVT